MQNPFDELDSIIQKALETIDHEIAEKVENLLNRESNPIEMIPLTWLQERLQLDTFERLLITMLFAPELYAKYEKIYAYLQDDLNKAYPTVQLVDLLLCRTAEESQKLYSYFITPSKLTMLCLVEFASEESTELLFTRPLKLSTSLRNYLLGDMHIKGTLPTYCRLLEPVESGACELEIKSDKRYIVNLYGYADGQKITNARQIASQLGFGLLTVDTEEAMKHNGDTAQLVSQCVRDALLCGAIIYFESFDALLRNITANRERNLLKKLEQLVWVSMVSTRSTWNPMELPQSITFYPVKTTESVPFAKTAQNALDRYAKAIISGNTMDDIVIPEKQKTQLHEVTIHYSHQSKVFEEWGYQKFFQSQGITLLFSGSSGTGKTMAASIVANRLGLALYKIDLSHMVSKYIGETEKNLSNIFELAQGSGVVLFFDEADAIFGKRAEVKEAHDRYANIEVSYLLQKIEEYEGIVILASNFKENIDEAFLRRFRFIIDFPTPDAEHREKIWHKVLPEKLLNSPMDFSTFAKSFKLSGANIRNIALYAAFYAAEKNSKIAKEHLVKALKNELEKTGTSFNARDIDTFLKN